MIKSICKSKSNNTTNFSFFFIRYNKCWGLQKSYNSMEAILHSHKNLQICTYFYLNSLFVSFFFFVTTTSTFVKKKSMDFLNFICICHNSNHTSRLRVLLTCTFRVYIIKLFLKNYEKIKKVTNFLTNFLIFHKIFLKIYD